MQDLEPALKAGLRYSRSGDLAVLTLDTPDSPVNILTDAMAGALLDSLSRAVDEGARALVLRSDKPRSFLNGARLLAAATVRTEAEARAGANAMRRVYAALAACPLTTIAVVEGSCFGCGMELTLCCDHRVVSASSCAQFYMTEIPDYLITPVFGSTQRLPLLLGLRGAAEMLLWGRRVRGDEARRIGLADATLGIGGEERDLARFVDGLGRAGFRKAVRARPKADPRMGAKERERIATLPLPVQPLFRRCLELMELPFEAGYTLEAGLAEELSSFSEMVLAPRARQAIAYFFVRQTARAVMCGSAASALPPSMAVAVEEGTSLSWFRERLAERPTRGLVSRRRGGVGTVGLHASSARRQRGDDDVLVCDAREAPPADRVALRLLVPGMPEPACELSVPPGRRPPRGLVELLELLDLHPVMTRPVAGSAWIGDRLLAAYFRPVARFLAEGGTLADADRALSAFGFALLPGTLPAAVGKRAAWRLLRGTAADGVVKMTVPVMLHATPSETAAPEETKRERGAEDSLVERVLASLGAEASACLAERVVPHPSQLDVLARAMFGFPLWESSLLRNRGIAQPRSLASTVG